MPAGEVITIALRETNKVLMAVTNLETQELVSNSVKSFNFSYEEMEDYYFTSTKLHEAICGRKNAPQSKKSITSSLILIARFHLFI
jgi:hypothetical protein